MELLKTALISSFAIWLSTPATASNDFVPIYEKAKFEELVVGRTLRLGLFGVELTVSNDGTIAGKAIGSEVSGTWSWEDGLFCRTMDWSGYEIEYNCQLVEASADQKVRFTVDGGKGRSGTFSIR